MSSIGLGCAGFGGIGSEASLFGQGEDEKTAFSLMDHAFEVGINLFDTANSYGGGRSEEMVGRWLSSRRGRNEVVLATKVATRLGTGVNDGGLSRRHILQQVEESLRRLGTDWLDLYVTHQVDPETALDETLRALDDLVRSGKVRYIGASNIEGWRLVKGLWTSDRLGLARFELAQNEYNLLQRTAEAQVLPVTADQDLAFVAYSPLAGGWLTGKYRSREPHPSNSRMKLRPGPYSHLGGEQTFAAIEALAGEAAQRGVSTGALALAWVTSHPRLTSALVGPRSLDQFGVAVESLQLTLSAEERAAIAQRMLGLGGQPGQLAAGR
ncbi:aldo/keto reductase [Candidatus Nephthysia bennettiae]|uniref:Aldo/keto reductase n=1 Tax=Candidatus Nephthysia bennettiae TaxID=3127016 RepID=A0A934KD02_9BACT|nr:aldo/keto reductase [Candidatus Dormibacteraeota bacterium]